MKYSIALLLYSIAATNAFAPNVATLPKFSLQKLSPPPPPAARQDMALYGIPKMFRWLTDQYPSINRQLREGLDEVKKVDNFYLDMNGIIHPCTHGNSDDLVVLNETEMFKKIFLYVDRLYKLVQPQNILYLAVDGVAPRAK